MRKMRGPRGKLILTSVFLLVLLALIIIFWQPLWSNLFWPYFWAPIVADAGGNSGGITAAYNPVDTGTYAAVLAIALFLIYRSFNKWKVKVDATLIWALVPLIVAGGVWRALEDAELFSEPLQYMFISPFIYIVMGVLTYCAIVFGHRLRKTGEEVWLKYNLAAVIAFNVAVIGLGYAFKDQLNGSVPAYLLPVISLAVFAIFYIFNKNMEIKANRTALTLLFFTVPLFLHSIVTAGWFLTDEGWRGYYEGIWGTVPETRPEAAFLITACLLASAVAYAVVALVLCRLQRKREGGFCMLLGGTNLAIMVGHFLDATATAVGLNIYGYTEKHVVPNMMIGIAGGNAWIMYLLKLPLILAVVYVLDVLYREEFKDDPVLVGLIKTAVIVLGLAPGTRDAARIVLGV